MNNNSTISLRIPKAMLLDLRKVMEKEHYVDLSEVIRYIIRLKWLEDMELKKSSRMLAGNVLNDEELSIAALLKNKELIKKILRED